MQNSPGSWINTEAKVLGPDGKPWQVSQGYDSFDLPHVLTFNGIISSAWKTYFHGAHDDAIRNDADFALSMRRDPQIMALLQERKMATVSLPWHLEIGDQRNPEHQAVSSNVTTVCQRTPRLKMMLMYLLEAIWYGRYAAQLEYGWEQIMLPDPKNERQNVLTRCPVVRRHVPVEGDKVGYKHDGTPYIQIYGGKSHDIPGAEIIPATSSRAITLTGTWRRKFVIHQHEALDASFWNPEQAGMVHGVGVRHVLYWMAWLKKEILGNILDYCERTGLGLRIWYYQAGNPESKRAVEDAARHQTDRTNIIVPRQMTAGARSAEGVEFQESGSGTGASNLLMNIFTTFDGSIERFVVGQTLSAGTEGSGLGGSGVAGMHATTKYLLTSYDADNLAETLVTDWVRHVLGWMYPHHSDLPVQWVFDKQLPDPAAAMQAIQQAWSMGVTFDEADVRSITGRPEPGEGAKLISQVELQKAIAAAKPQQPGIPGDGDGDGIAGEGDEPTDADYEALFAEMGGAF